MLDLRRNELAIKAPGVCVEPSENMLRIATKKEGIVPVLSIALKNSSPKARLLDEIIASQWCFTISNIFPKLYGKL